MKKDTSNKPRFATNWEDPKQSVAEAINRFLGSAREVYAVPPELSIASAYFNAGGFSLIADELEKAPRIRLLLGAEPDREVIADLSPTEEQRENFKAAVTSHEAWLEHERDLVGFTLEENSNAKRLVEWLRSLDAEALSKVEVRKYNAGFLHGKAFIANHPEPSASMVMAGSSNFTFSGLSKNAELMVGVHEQSHVEYVMDWFNTFWEMSEPFDLAELYERRWQDHSPWLIFMRMLWERYGDHIDDELFAETLLELTEFQSDGVHRAMRLMNEIGGVLVSDEVGLGKTFIAGEIIKQISEKERQRVLILAPASLCDGMWNPFLKKFNLSRRIDVMSFARLRILSDPNNYQSSEEYLNEISALDDYGLVVVDEAHNLRNEGAGQSKALSKLLSGPNPKRVLLLTATPVNNTLSDLETLIRYFVRDDAAFAKVGIPSISKFIKRAQAMDPDSLSPKHLFDLMDRVAVRRTRTFVKKFYPNATIKDAEGNNVPIVFPEPKLYQLAYELHEKGMEVVNQVVYALEIPENEGLIGRYKSRRDDENRLMMARYTPSMYSKSAELEKYQINNAGLLRSALLKRLESSPVALENTLKVLIKSHEDFISGLNKGFVMAGKALREWGTSENDSIDELIEKLGEDASRLMDPIADFDEVALRFDVNNDLDLLKRILKISQAARKESDPKVNKLLTGLSEIAKKSQKLDTEGVSERDRRKVIIFSTYSDTVEDVHAQITNAINNAKENDPLALYKMRIAPPVSGRNSGDQSQSEVIEGFAPKNSQKTGVYDKYDIIVTTDLLSEGVNLQQAGQIINYDLPWNPMKIVQRHGRIDRIGSEHRFVHLGLFYPDKALDKLLRLEAILQRKIAYAAAAIGQTNVMVNQASHAEVNLADKMQIDAEVDDQISQIMKLVALDASVLKNAGGAISGEEYRRRLFKAISEDLIFGNQVKTLPFGSGSGFISSTPNIQGYIFCIQIKGDFASKKSKKQKQRPWLVFVPTDKNWTTYKNEDGSTAIINDTLPALMVADPQNPDTPRVLSEEAYSGAFSAWSEAQKWAFGEWQAMTDGRNLQPDIPLAFKEATQLLMLNPGQWGINELQDLLARLNNVPQRAIQNAVRQVLDKTDLNESEKATEIKTIVEDAGLQPRMNGSTLPPASIDEVRLVTWMAVKSAELEENPDFHNPPN